MKKQTIVTSRHLTNGRALAVSCQGYNFGDLAICRFKRDWHIVDVPTGMSVRKYPTLSAAKEKLDAAAGFIGRYDAEKRDRMIADFQKRPRIAEADLLESLKKS